jgi:hypothetical protein
LVHSAEPSADDAATLTPVLKHWQWGPVLELRARLTPDDEQVMLDIATVVSELLDTKHAAVIALPQSEESGRAVGVELPEFLAYSLTTTIRAPLEEPVLVGALTAPVEEGPSDTVLCLIVTAIAEDDD